MAALRGADGAFLLGEMAPHTLNAGQIYFPAGTPDPSDVFDGKVDLDASARRELLEETGIAADEAAIRRGWTVVFAPRRIACMKLMTLAVPAEEAKARIDAFLARDPPPEFTRMHVVRGAEDIDETRTPAFVAAYLRAAFASRSRLEIRRIAVTLLRGDDHRFRLGVMTGRADPFRRADFPLDLVVDRLDDMAHRQVVILDRAVAGDLRLAVAALGQLEVLRGHRNRPRRRRRRGLRGGALQAASPSAAKTAKTSGVFIGGPRLEIRISA